MKFGVAPKAGCAEVLFSLKSMLQSIREMDIDANAIFVDLLKACDSMKYAVMSLSLKKMGAPDRHVKWVEKLYGDVIFKVGKE